jgi:hypothetical protein
MRLQGPTDGSAARDAYRAVTADTRQRMARQSVRMQEAVLQSTVTHDVIVDDFDVRGVEGQIVVELGSDLLDLTKSSKGKRVSQMSRQEIESMSCRTGRTQHREPAA